MKIKQQNKTKKFEEMAINDEAHFVCFGIYFPDVFHLDSKLRPCAS